MGLRSPKAWEHGVLWSVSWWVTILGAAEGLPWLGAIPAGIWLIWFVLTKPSILRPVLAALLMGFVAEQLFWTLGAISHPEGVLPFWLVFLWLGFGMGFGTCMTPIMGRWGAMAFTAQLAPLAYWGAEGFNLIRLNGYWWYPIIAVGYIMVIAVMNLVEDLAQRRLKVTPEVAQEAVQQEAPSAMGRRG